MNGQVAQWLREEYDPTVSLSFQVLKDACMISAMGLNNISSVVLRFLTWRGEENASCDGW